MKRFLQWNHGYAEVGPEQSATSSKGSFVRVLAFLPCGILYELFAQMMSPTYRQNAHGIKSSY